MVGYIKDSKKYVPIDGFHRLMAIQWLSSDAFKNDPEAPSVDHLDLQTVNVEVRPFETLKDAIIASASSNSTHGMKRQRGDIKNAIEAILEVDRERFMDGMFKLNKKAIMEVVNCSARSFEVETQEIRASLASSRDDKVMELYEDEGLTLGEISTKLGVPKTTVKRIVDTLSVPKTQDAQMEQSEESEEEPSIFAHMTSARAIENPWEDDEDTTEPSKNLPEGSATLSISATELDASVNQVTDDVLFQVLAALTPEQQEMARNYLDTI